MINQKSHEQLLLWLSSSYWLIEAQLFNVRARRGNDTLKWARNMPEFRTWVRSDLETESPERVLWIRGPLGIGKSTMAGYFIDLLKCLYPASVAYFFCKAGQSGLTSAIDILRTLAHQCCANNREALSTLDSLRTSGFRIDESLGIQFLFEKLLHDPLIRSHQEVFLVIDGLDEADWEKRDSVEDHSEMDLLVECLSTLPLTRLLFISRPSADISRIIPQLIIKPIRNENRPDIRAYIIRTVERSERLRIHFENEGIDPIDYFAKHANGIFLWVVLVLRQLAKAKSTSTFRIYVHRFSEISGDMERLYSSILSRIASDDRIWVREILRWVAVEDRNKFNITLDVLQEAVEWTLRDTLPEFKKFLEIECGSFLDVLWSEKGLYAQLIHETVRVFLFDRTACPPEFWIDHQDVHSHVATVCLDILINGMGTATTRNCMRYALSHWTEHIAQISLERPGPDLLDKLHQFFKSPCIKRWVAVLITNEEEHVDDEDVKPLYINFEERDIQIVIKYLHGMERVHGCDRIAKQVSIDRRMTSRDGASLNWAREILINPWKLGEIVGRYSAEIWLYESLKYSEIENAFRLALKQFCKSHGQRMDNVRFVKSLSERSFSCVRQWLSCPGRTVKWRNLALASFRLGEWNDSIAGYNEARRVEMLSPIDWRRLGAAYLKTGNYVCAISMLQITIKHNPNDLYAWELLWKAYRRVNAAQGVLNALDRAIKIIQLSDFETTGYTDEINMFHRRFLPIFMGEAFAEKGDHDNRIKLYERTIKRNLTEWWAKQFLADAYDAKGDILSALEVYEKAQRMNSNDRWASIAWRAITFGRDNSMCNNLRIPAITFLRNLNSDPDWFLVHNKYYSRQFRIHLMHTFNHSSAVDCVAFSPDGRYIATACYDSDQVFDIETGMKVASFFDEEMDMTLAHCRGKICFSFDGQYLASAGSNSDGIIRIWQISKNHLKSRLASHTARVTSICVLGSGNLLISGSDDYTVRTWDMDTAIEIRKFILRSEVISMALSYDGKLLAIALGDHSLSLLNNESGIIRHAEDLPYIEGSIAFTRHKYELAYRSDSMVYIWMWNLLNVPIIEKDEEVSSDQDMRPTGYEIDRFHCTDGVIELVWNYDSRLFICDSADGSVEIWDREDGQPLFRLCSHKLPGTNKHIRLLTYKFTQ